MVKLLLVRASWQSCPSTCLSDSLNCGSPRWQQPVTPGRCWAGTSSPQSQRCTPSPHHLFISVLQGGSFFYQSPSVPISEPRHFRQCPCACWPPAPSLYPLPDGILPTPLQWQDTATPRATQGPPCLPSRASGPTSLRQDVPGCLYPLLTPPHHTRPFRRI